MRATFDEKWESIKIWNAFLTAFLSSLELRDVDNFAQQSSIQNNFDKFDAEIPYGWNNHQILVWRRLGFFGQFWEVQAPFDILCAQSASQRLFNKTSKAKKDFCDLSLPYYLNSVIWKIDKVVACRGLFKRFLQIRRTFKQYHQRFENSSRDLIEINITWQWKIQQFVSAFLRSLFNSRERNCIEL